jgi:hypothetical protein
MKAGEIRSAPRVGAANTWRRTKGCGLDPVARVFRFLLVALVPLVPSRSFATNVQCSTGARCIQVDANGRPNPNGQFTAQCTGTFPDFIDIVPDAYAGPRFELSQDYPEAPPPQGLHPWIKFNPRDPAQVDGYMFAIRAYTYEGMLESDWRGDQNKVRKWYQVPWMTAGNHPREFIHGMTEERFLTGPELGLKSGITVQNWAVGYYNDVGGLTIGKVWKNLGNLTSVASQFGEGTVVAKVLFTAAAPNDFETTSGNLLDGAPEWQVNAQGNSPQSKQIQTLRLLQMDIAVKDSRAGTTGWIFGTFAYNREVKADDGWHRMMPVGLMWGNDPTLNQVAYAQGRRPVEGIVSPSCPLYARNHLGWLGRVNGPVDNPASACMSCHSIAESPPSAPLMASDKCTDEKKLNWFRDLSGSVSFGKVPMNSCDVQSDADSVALDYSLQMRVAIANARSVEWLNPCESAPPKAKSMLGPVGPLYPTLR